MQENLNVVGALNLSFSRSVPFLLFKTDNGIGFRGGVSPQQSGLVLDTGELFSSVRSVQLAFGVQIISQLYSDRFRGDSD